MSSHKPVRLAEPFWKAFLEVGLDQGEALSALVTPTVTFRGSFGITVQGVDGIAGYVHQAEQVFEGFNITVGEVTGDANLAAVRLVFSGRHQQPLLGIAPTGKQIEYDGMAWMRFEDDRFTDIWVMGDAAEWMGLFKT
jgi:predicted ester cyclase